MLLVSDSHLLEERFLEDISNLLNNGEVPDLLVHDDMIRIHLGLCDRGFIVSKVPSNMFSTATGGFGY